MRIDKRTKTIEVVPLLNEERLFLILDNVRPVPLDKPIAEMTIGEFIEASAQDYQFRFYNDEFAFDAFGKIKTYRQEMESVAKYIKSLEVKTDADEDLAMAGVDFPNAAERMLIDAADWFGLHALESRDGVMGAADVPLAEYLIMLKDKSAKAKYERNRQRQFERKQKTKR